MGGFSTTIYSGSIGDHQLAQQQCKPLTRAARVAALEQFKTEAIRDHHGIAALGSERPQKEDRAISKTRRLTRQEGSLRTVLVVGMSRLTSVDQAATILGLC